MDRVCGYNMQNYRAWIVQVCSLYIYSSHISTCNGGTVWY